MKSLLLAALFVVPAVAHGDGPPCRVPLSSRPETVPALSREVSGLSELEIQKRCLKWEYNLPQKAEFIPPYADPRPPMRADVVVPPIVTPPPAAATWVVPRSTPFGWPATYEGLFERQTPWLSKLGPESAPR